MTKGTFYKLTTEMPVYAWAKALFLQDYYPSASGAYANWNIPANSSYQYSWRGNDLYDPDYSSGSATDTSVLWGSGFYQQFRQFCVYASKITIKGQFINFGGANDPKNRVYLWPSDDNSSPTETSILLNPGARGRILDTQYNSGNGGHFKFKMFAKTKDVMGRKVEEGYDPSGDGSGMGGLLGTTGTGSSPTSPWFWNIRFLNGYTGSGVPAPLNSTNACHVTMRVKIMYYVKLFNRITTVTTNSYGTNVPL